MNNVEKLFMNRAIMRGGVYLHTKTQALAFIDECSKHQIPILGIDGFFITDTTTQPSLDNSIDFTVLQSSSNKLIYSEAKKFLLGKDEQLYFEIVCGQ